MSVSNYIDTIILSKPILKVPQEITLLSENSASTDVDLGNIEEEYNGFEPSAWYECYYGYLRDYKKKGINRTGKRIVEFK